ncbi:MAG: AraC family transcriptional regulator [Microcella sp.]|uniref:AraC family transcriptional regulator n=1 Tax=Microcella sp. TaxID=1913979 RepID=UPI0033159597
MSEPLFVPREVPDDLRHFVQALWYLRTAPQRRFEKILPSPRAHLIVNLAAPYRQLARGATATGVELEGPFLAGVQTQYLVNENPAELRMLVAQFTADGIGLYARAKPVELVDAVLPAESVVPGVNALAARARRAGEPEAMLDDLVDVLRAARHRPVPDAAVARARIALESDRPASITRLALSEEMSARALSARFATACGVTPKRFADVARFDALLTSLAARDTLPTWGELVEEYGYYDQPHITRAFTRFAGSPPARFLHDLGEFGLEYATFVPLDHPAHA